MIAAVVCSLATAQAAIRATGVRVPSLAGGLERADPAQSDKAVCFSGGLAVSLASGATAGDVAWIAFARSGTGWRVLKAAGGYKLGLFSRAGGFEIVQPVYRRNDPNCCPTGGFDRVLYRVDAARLVTARRWHTRTFTGP